MASENKDVVVSIDTPIPHGYKFLPKGDPHKTLNCRKKARAEGHIVYVVHNPKHQQIGIRIPAAIHDRVQEKSEPTQQSQAKAVQRKDKKMEAEFRGSVRSQFPQIPASDLERVVKHTLTKNSGRVGRTTKLPLNQKAELAVCAHIRHRHTDYENLLANKVPRNDAREQIFEKVKKVAKEWGGK
ncbi:hypothetical protein M434DRAFT_63888, partial [Hypoxylon sp. CO27-5]